MERTTERQLEKLVEMIAQEFRWAKLLPDETKIILEKGSKTYGRAFRLYSTGYENNSGYSDKPLAPRRWFSGTNKA
jgi:hypothetical protein